jgi:hypothetical protein
MRWNLFDVASPPTKIYRCNHHVVVSFNIFPSRRSMRSIRGVLESSRAALSMRRIISLNGRLFDNCSG